MFVAIRNALVKTPGDRSQFDRLAMEQVEAKLNGHLQGLEELLSSAEKTNSEKVGVCAEAAAALEAAQKCRADFKQELEAAKVAKSEGDVSLGKTREAAEAAEVTLAEARSLLDTQERLSARTKETMEAFTFLYERRINPESPPCPCPCKVTEAVEVPESTTEGAEAKSAAMEVEKVDESAEVIQKVEEPREDVQKVEKPMEKSLVDEFRSLRSQATSPSTKTAEGAAMEGVVFEASTTSITSSTKPVQPAFSVVFVEESRVPEETKVPEEPERRGPKGPPVAVAVPEDAKTQEEAETLEDPAEAETQKGEDEAETPQAAVEEEQRTEEVTDEAPTSAPMEEDEL